MPSLIEQHCFVLVFLNRLIPLTFTFFKAIDLKLFTCVHVPNTFTCLEIKALRILSFSHKAKVVSIG